MKGNLQLLNDGKPDEHGEYIWRMRVFLGRDGTGKQRVASRTFRWKPPSERSKSNGQDEAETAMAEFLTHARQDRVDYDRKTVTYLAEHWIKAELTHGLSPTTERSYRQIIKNKIIPEFGNRVVSSVTSYELDAFYQRELARTVRGHPVAPATVIKYHRVLSSMFRQAERWGWVNHSPTRNARAPKLPATPIEAPSLETIRELLNHCPEDCRLFFLLAAALGARRGEIMGLKWGDVDFTTGVVSLSRSVYEKTGGGVGVKPTKTDKPRKVTLDQRTIVALVGVKGDAHPKHFIFHEPGQSLAPRRPDYMTKHFADAREKVPAAKNVRLHDLRHYHATTLIAAGIDIVTVSKRLGHAKVSTTLDIYTSALQQRDQAAADIVGGLGLDSPIPPGIALEVSPQTLESPCDES